MNTTYNHIGEMAQDWRRELEHRKDDLIDQVAYLDEKIELIENVGIMIEETENCIRNWTKHAVSWTRNDARTPTWR